MRIIGFGPFHKTGKDTIVKFALSYMKIEHPQIKCQRFSLGDKIRDLAYELYSWAGMEDCTYYLNHPEKKDELLPALGKTPRQVCVELAEAYYRIHPRTLFELAIKNVDADILFWPDLYRLTEVQFVKDFGGTTVKVFRPGNETQSLKEDVIPPDYHMDVLLINDGTLKELNQKVKRLCDAICSTLDDSKAQ